MARLRVTLATAIPVSGIGYAFMRDRQAEPSQHAAAPAASRPDAAPGDALQVDELAAKPGNYGGEIPLRGVVAGVSQACAACIENCRSDAIASNFCDGDCTCPTCCMMDGIRKVRRRSPAVAKTVATIARSEPDGCGCSDQSDE